MQSESLPRHEQSPEDALRALHTELRKVNTAIDELTPLHQRWMELNNQVDIMARSAEKYGNSPLYAGKRSWILGQETGPGAELVKVSHEYKEKKEEAGFTHTSYENLLRRKTELEQQHYAMLIDRLQKTAAEIQQPLELDATAREQLLVGLAVEIQADWQMTSGYHERWKPLKNDPDFIRRHLQLFAQGDEHTRQTFRIVDTQKKDKPAIDLDHFTFPADGKMPAGLDAEEDIQNRLNSELAPRNAQLNNEAAAAVFEIVDGDIRAGKKLDKEWLESAAARVHVGWKARNSWVELPDADPAEEARRVIQRREYADPGFTEEQRNKDRNLVVLAVEAYAKELAKTKVTTV